MAQIMAQALAATPRPSVLWISGQECTGCTESLLRSFDPTIEGLILNHFSLDYHNTLTVASGTAAESAREKALAGGGHILIVDGSIPEQDEGAWSIIGGKSALQVVQESAANAGLIMAIGNCAAFGGVPRAKPDPGKAKNVKQLIDKGMIPSTIPLINLPGCPQVPEVITGVIAYFLAFGSVPALDNQERPLVYYGKTVHDCCTRLPQYEAGIFAKSFDDEAARNGACLFLLGCKGPETFNACSTVKWNQGTSFPMHSGHGCIGCSEPDFWDRSEGFYGVSVREPKKPDKDVDPTCTAPQPPELT